MKRLVNMITALALAVPAGILSAEELSVDAQIAEAVSPLPESARADATVINYDAKGNPTMLRQGSNGIICVPNRPEPSAEGQFNVQCYGKGLTPQHDMMVKLLAQGKSHEDAAAALTAALNSGKLQPPPAGTMAYYKRGKTADDARILWILHLPNATAESLGLPTKPGQGSPWMMFSGTPRAHVMLPQTEAGLAAGRVQRQ
jgi:hypothetical protein